MGGDNSSLLGGTHVSSFVVRSYPDVQYVCSSCELLIHRWLVWLWISAGCDGGGALCYAAAAEWEVDL
ncbi:unnamed protein product [Urochloa humidicola]